MSIVQSTNKKLDISEHDLLECCVEVCSDMPREERSQIQRYRMLASMTATVSTEESVSRALPKPRGYSTGFPGHENSLRCTGTSGRVDAISKVFRFKF